MKKRKWLYTLLIVILVLPILFFYDAFNGNPLSKQISKYTLKNYLDKTYPEEDFRINDPIYNFKMSGYEYEVQKIGEANQTDYEFTVTGMFGTTVHYDEIYYDNQDTTLIAKLEKEASEQLAALFKEDISELIHLGVELEVLKDRYPPDTTWDKTFEPEVPMSIFIVIDTRHLSREDILEYAKMIQQTLNDEKYSYDNVNINANVYDEELSEEKEDPSWYVKYAVWFDPNRKLKLKHVE